MGYTQLNIKNFRSIALLEIDSFKDINLFTGRNNCGKTSVLEALFLISGMSNSSLPISINNFRNLPINSNNDLNVIFNNLNLDKPVKIQAKMPECTIDLSIKPKFSESNAVNQTNKTTSINGLSYETSASCEKYKELIPCYFFSSGTSQNLLETNLEDVFVNKQVDVVIKTLKEIDEKIIDIRMGANGMIYIDIGLEKLVPVNIMGDGIRRILSIISSMLKCKNGILLIDEIENGFHYSALKILWKVIFKVSELHNVQLFITTHSEECISALSGVLKEKYTDNSMLYRIEKQTDKHKAFSYNSEMIISGIENNFEVR